jgi:hypothetical protein
MLPRLAVKAGGRLVPWNCAYKGLQKGLHLLGVQDRLAAS